MESDVAEDQEGVNSTHQERRGARTMMLKLCRNQSESCCWTGNTDVNGNIRRLAPVGQCLCDHPTALLTLNNFERNTRWELRHKGGAAIPVEGRRAIRTTTRLIYGHSHWTWSKIPGQGGVILVSINEQRCVEGCPS